MNRLRKTFEKYRFFAHDVCGENPRCRECSFFSVKDNYCVFSRMSLYSNPSYASTLQATEAAKKRVYLQFTTIIGILKKKYPELYSNFLKRTHSCENQYLSARKNPISKDRCPSCSPHSSHIQCMLLKGHAGPHTGLKSEAGDALVLWDNKRELGNKQRAEWRALNKEKVREYEKRRRRKREYLKHEFAVKICDSMKGNCRNCFLWDLNHNRCSRIGLISDFRKRVFAQKIGILKKKYPELWKEVNNVCE